MGWRRVAGRRPTWWRWLSACWIGRHGNSNNVRILIHCPTCGIYTEADDPAQYDIARSHRLSIYGDDARPKQVALFGALDRYGI